MAKAVTHLSKVSRRRDHTVVGTLCHRMSNSSDDMNCTEVVGEVSCKLCVREIDRRASRQGRAA